MARKENHDHYPESVIGPSVRVEGDLISEGNLQVEGTVNGKVNTLKDLFVGETARIQADINAENATIAGVVEGNIEVEHTLVIKDTGKVLGNIVCAELGVHEGAYFSGQVDMKREADPRKVSVALDDDSEDEDEE
jgi:cytoskeletal protein CcmA (bactofilin family)